MTDARAERPPGPEPPPDPTPPDPGPTPGTPPQETPPPVVSADAASERDGITVLTEAVLIATGCSNVHELAMSAGRLDRLPPDERGAVRARLGLDALAAGRPARPRSVGEVAAVVGVTPADAGRLLDGALARLRASGAA